MAHAAVRGKPKTWESKCLAAKTRERKQLHNGLGETWLHERLPGSIIQKAVGAYNVDVAWRSIAVELHGGAWHGKGRHAARFAERSRYLFDQGWHLLIVWLNQGRPMTAAVVDHTIALAQFAERHPSARRQCRVIWSTGELWAIGHEGDLDKLSGVPALRRRPYIVR
jgi:very-short-patch-repair endonuclease